MTGTGFGLIGHQMRLVTSSPGGLCVNNTNPANFEYVAIDLGCSIY